MEGILWVLRRGVHWAGLPDWVISSGPRHVRVEAAIQSKADLAGTEASRRLVGTTRTWRLDDSVTALERGALRCRLDQGVRQPVGRLGQHSTEAKSQGPHLLSPYLYLPHNLVERFFNKIKQCRRIATRYDKLAANYLAFIKLASIRLWLRVYEFTP